MRASAGLPSWPEPGWPCFQAASAAAGSLHRAAFEEPQHRRGLSIRMHQADDDDLGLIRQLCTRIGTEDDLEDGQDCRQPRNAP